MLVATDRLSDRINSNLTRREIISSIINLFKCPGVVRSWISEKHLLLQLCQISIIQSYILNLFFITRHKCRQNPLLKKCFSLQQMKTTTEIHTWIQGREQQIVGPGPNRLIYSSACASKDQGPSLKRVQKDIKRQNTKNSAVAVKMLEIIELKVGKMSISMSMLL